MRIHAKAIVDNKSKTICSVESKWGSDDADNYEILLFTEDVIKERERIKLELFIPSDQCWSINSRRNLVELKNTQLYFPSGCFVVVRQMEKFYRIDLPKIPFISVKRIQNGFLVSMPVKSRQSCGLIRFSDAKISSINSPIQIYLFVNRINSPENTVWFEPFPGQAKSALIITDHADWDTVEKFRLISRVLKKYKISITKSVFPFTEMYHGIQHHGVNTPGYKELLREFKSAGNEIAFHGFTSARDAPEYDECVRRMESMKEFKPETWIDHGIGDYLFSRNGELSNGISLFEFLTSYGIKNFWSYGDIYNDPAKELNSFESRGYHSIFTDLFRSLCGNSKLSFKASTYISGHVVKNFFGASAIKDLLSKSRSAGNYRKMLREFKLNRIRRKNPFTLYDLNGITPMISNRGEWIFDTILINHPAFQLRPEAIDKLIYNGGISIMHTYLSSNKSYIANSCIRDSNEAPELSEIFVKNIEYIAFRQSQSGIVTLSFADFRKSLEKLKNSKLIFRNNKWFSSNEPEPVTFKN